MKTLSSNDRADQFDQDLRHRCRNPRCRMKLPQPVENPHKAFCTPGCCASFYLKKCVVCERAKPPGRSNRKFCRRPKCRSEYHKNPTLFGENGPSTANHTDSSKSADKTGTKTGQVGGRAIHWRRLSAGPTLTLSQLRCGVVPDGPGTQWAGGSIERIEAANRRALEAHFDKLDSAAIDYCSVCGREDDLVDYKVGNRWVTTCREHRQTAATASAAGAPSSPIPDNLGIPNNLSIPTFLKREQS